MAAFFKPRTDSLKIVIAFRSPIDTRIHLSMGYYDSEDSNPDSFTAIVNDVAKGDWILYDVGTGEIMPSRTDAYFRENYAPVNDLAINLLGNINHQLRDYSNGQVYWSAVENKFITRQEEAA